MLKSKHQKVLTAGCMIHIIQDGLTSCVVVLLPLLTQSFGLTYTQAAALKALGNLTQAGVELASGWLSEWQGEARVLIAGLFLSGAGYLLLSAAPDIMTIALCLALVGAGTALHHAPSSALIANNFSTSKSRALGYYNASGDIGKLAFTGGFSLATGMGLAWTGITFLYAVVTFAAMLALILLMASLRSVRQATPSDEPQSASPETPPTGWGILHPRAFTGVLVISALDTWAQSGILVFIAFLMLAKGIPLSLATFATVLLLAGGVFGKSLCGALADKIGTRKVFVLVQFLTVAGVVAVVLLPGWIAYAVLIPLGAVVQGSSSIIYALAAGLFHPQRMSRGYALLYSAGSLAAAIGLYLLGRISDAYGVEMTLYGIAVCTLISVPPIFMLRRQD